MMNAIKFVPVVVGGALLLSACGSTVEQRAASGALGGAVVGGVLGGDTSSTVAGAVVGGVAGAATTPK